MSARFAIYFSEGAQEDVAALRAYDRAIILDAIEAQLATSPHVDTRKRKRLHNLVPPFEAIAPVWQLQVRAFRVFYDVDAAQRRVYVRAIRRKPGHLRTEEIL